jgi:cephalosporin-C deacetylase-like acetyl esterase
MKRRITDSLNITCNTFDIRDRVPYLYVRDKEQFRPHFLKEKDGVKLFELRYKSPVNSPYPKNNEVYSWYIESPEKKNAVVFLHGWKVGDISRWLFFGSLLAKRGISVLLLELPYHMHRRPGGRRNGELFIVPDAVRTFNSYEQTVLDARKGIDFLQERGFFKIGLVGASVGSMCGVIVHALDKRIKKSILIISGGDIEMLKWRSPATVEVRKDHRSIGVTHGVCIRNRRYFDSFINKIKKGKHPTEVQAEVACYYFDPLAFAPLINRNNVLMLNGLFDMIIPKQSTLKLWRALNKPRLVWYPLSHFSIYLAFPAIIKRITRFLMTTTN